MFGFIKKLFGGISAFLGGLFSSKKSQDNQSSTPKTRKASGYYVQLDEAEDNQPTTITNQAASQPVAEKQPEPPKVAAEPAKVEQKQPEPVKDPVPAASTNGKVEQAQPELTFAPKYLNPASSSSSRRRPGPSMSNFLNLARQVKTSNG